MKNSLFALVLALSASVGASPDLLPLLQRTADENVSSKITSTTLSAAGCRLKKVTVTGKDPFTLQPRSVLLKDYRPLGRGNATNLKTVLLMPPTGGENLLDWSYANHLCLRGMRVVLVSQWDFQAEASLDPIMHDRGAIRAVSAMRHTMDYINPIRPGQVGILGTSVGAMSAVLGMALDERISAGFFIVGGGGISQIIGESTEQTLAGLRQQRMEALGLKSVADYRAYLATKLFIDPLDFVHQLRHRPTSFVIATQDLTVPTATQEDLFRESGTRDVLRLNGNHKDVIIKTSVFHKARVRRFFNKTLQ